MSTYKEWNNYLTEIISPSTNNTIFIKFMLLWMAYNEYYNNIPNTSIYDSDKACSIKDNQLFSSKYETIKDDALLEFKAIEPFSGVKERRCVVNCKYNQINHKRNAYFHAQKDSFEDFLRAIYQIRCNLFHGNKTPYSSIDKKLVSWAYKFLLEILSQDQNFQLER